MCNQSENYMTDSNAYVSWQRQPRTALDTTKDFLTGMTGSMIKSDQNFKVFSAVCFTNQICTFTNFITEYVVACKLSKFVN